MKVRMVKSTTATNDRVVRIRLRGDVVVDRFIVAAIGVDGDVRFLG